MIFYLSSTGNTKWAAEQIASATGERLLYIPAVMDGAETGGGFGAADGHSLEYRLEPDERIGFCFPVHGWRPPVLVREFVRRLRIHGADGHYCFAVCTAGDNIGETMDIFGRNLSEAGLHIDSAYSLIMPESYVGLPFMDVDKPQKEARKKRDAATALRRYIGDIVSRRKGQRHLVTGRWPRTNSRIIGHVFEKSLITDRPFRVDEAKCARCGLCTSLCPVKDILGGKGRTPEWRHNGRCLTCFSCYHHCPKRAISFGKRTRNKGQYYFEHPTNTQEQ